MWGTLVKYPVLLPCGEPNYHEKQENHFRCFLVELLQAPKTEGLGSINEFCNCHNHLHNVIQNENSFRSMYCDLWGCARMALNLILNSKTRIVSQFVTSPSANERLLVVEFCVKYSLQGKDFFLAKKRGHLLFRIEQKLLWHKLLQEGATKFICFQMAKLACTHVTLLATSWWLGTSSLTLVGHYGIDVSHFVWTHNEWKPHSLQPWPTWESLEVFIACSLPQNSI